MCPCHCEFEEVDLAPLDKLIDEMLPDFPGGKGALIPILQRGQELYGFLPRPVLRHIARRTGTPGSRKRAEIRPVQRRDAWRSCCSTPLVRFVRPLLSQLH